MNQRFKKIVDRATIGHLMKCSVCGKLMMQPISSYFKGMKYSQRLASGDELLRHFLETAGFDLEKEKNIAILTFLAHERGGHSSFEALKLITLYDSKEDQEWMEEYGRRQRELLDRVLGDKDFEEW